MSSNSFDRSRLFVLVLLAAVGLFVGTVLLAVRQPLQVPKFARSGDPWGITSPDTIPEDIQSGDIRLERRALMTAFYRASRLSEREAAALLEYICSAPERDADHRQLLIRVASLASGALESRLVQQLLETDSVACEPGSMGLIAAILSEIDGRYAACVVIHGETGHVESVFAAVVQEIARARGVSVDSPQ